VIGFRDKLLLKNLVVSLGKALFVIELLTKSTLLQQGLHFGVPRHIFEVFQYKSFLLALAWLCSKIRCYQGQPLFNGAFLYGRIANRYID
jgi:hypothetical protein